MIDRKILSFTSAMLLFGLLATGGAAPPKPEPPKVYVPYEELKGVFDRAEQGVFLPYKEFQRLWRAAQGAPAGVPTAPMDYLISTARFRGRVGTDVATMQLELTVDVLAEGWVEVPIGLGEVAVSGASFAERGQVHPLLRVVKGQYVLLTKGKGRKVLKLDFVRQLQTRPGLNVLSFRMPAAAITTLELFIPEENMKVDVEPMLAATTSQATVDGKKGTRLQAFLGSAQSVKLSWKPTTQAAAELEPVIISTQLQHIDVGEALIRHDVKFTYDIRRRGVRSFTIQLPPGFRVTAVEGANISKWDIVEQARGEKAAPQILKVELFGPAKDAYALTVRMERFLKEADLELDLSPVVTREALRRTGLIAITRSPRRRVELRSLKNLARVDAGRLPPELRQRAGVMVYRFIAADYGGKLVIGTVLPRITLTQWWMLGVQDDRQELRGRLTYRIERTGVFRLRMRLPEPWDLTSVGPDSIVDDHQLTGQGAERTLEILLKREVTGAVALDLVARAPRGEETDPVPFTLPLPDAENLHVYSGQLVLCLAPRLRAEIESLQQLQALPLQKAARWTSVAGTAPAMAFQFRGIDRDRPAGAEFRIAVKPSQVSAVVHRLINIQPGSIEDTAVVQYRVLYAPVDTFYVKLPAAMADEGVEITGPNIKEKPRIDKLPPEEPPKEAAAAAAEAAPEAPKWAYYKIVLQSPVIGTYQLQVSARRKFQAGPVGTATTVQVPAVLAAGKLSDQTGHIAIAKADTLAIGQPVVKNLTPGDPGSAADLPYGPHRKVASLAFKYTEGVFALSLPVVTQAEAAVITTMATAAVVEQVLARDGKLNGRVIYLLQTSKGDRLLIALPEESRLYQVLLNGAEAPVENTANPNERIVRLPPSAGQVTKLVLEISYGQDDAEADELVVPLLPKDVPVQQTLWRVWLPAEQHVLGYDRVFTRLNTYAARDLLSNLAAGQPTAVRFALPEQGQMWHFLRQGAPGELSVTAMGKEAFAILLWIIIVGLGVYLLRCTALQRALAVLAAAMLLAVLQLFSPLFIRHVLRVGWWGAAVVAALWLAWWLLPSLKRWRARPAGPPPLPAGEGQAPEPPAKGKKGAGKAKADEDEE